MKLPRNWPAHFRYCPSSICFDLSENLLRSILSAGAEDAHTKISPRIETRTVDPRLQIRKITKTLRYAGPKPHPLSLSKKLERGVFAKEKIPEGTELGEYVGEISFGKETLDPPSHFKGFHCWKATFKNFSVHIFSGNIANELAFINDYRGLKDGPNVRPHWILHRDVYYFGYITTRDIEPMEELVTDYGKTWEQTKGAL